MDQHCKNPAANTAASSAASSGSSSSSSSRSMHGSMSSAFLGVSSSSTHSQRRSSPSLYPPPLPAPLPGHLASRGSAASSGRGSASASGSSSSRAAAPYRHHSRPSLQRTHSLPTPFLSELSSIRRMGANVFGHLNSQEMTRRPLLLPGQQEQEMTRSSSSFTMPHSHHHTPIPSGEFSGFPQQQQPLPMQQQQAQPLFSSLQPLPGGTGNFSSGFPLPASQPQQMQPSSSTVLPSRIFSGFEPPAEASQSQQFSTYLPPLPSWTTSSPSSSSCSADHAQPLSDSELPPLPPSLEMPQYGLPPLGHLSQNNGSSAGSSSSTCFVQPSSNSDSEMYELAPLPPSLQIPPPQLQQVNQEPVLVAPSLASEIISLEDDGDDLSALEHSIASSHAHGSASLPTNLENRDMLQWGGSAVDGDGQTMEATPALACEHDKVNNGGIPGNCHGHGSMPPYSQSQQQALQQLSDLLSVWSSTTMSSSSDQSMGSSSLSMQSSTPVPAADVPNLILGGMDRPGLPPRPPALGAGPSSGSMSGRGAMEHIFSEDDMQKINKDNRLRELVKTDLKRVKRILRNRVHVARLKDRKENQFKDLQCRADALKMECSSLSAQVQSHQEMMVNLKTRNREMQIKLEGLKEQASLNQALTQHLQSEIQRLKLLELNMMCTNGIHNPKSSQMAVWSASSSANGIQKVMHSHADDLIRSHEVQAHEHGTNLQLEEQPNQAVDDELMGQQQQP